MHDFSRVHRILRQRIGYEGDAPGAVLYVRFQGDVVFHHAYGYRQIVPRTLPATEDTLFDLASLTKSIGTSLAVMRLWNEQRICLDTPLTHYLREAGCSGKESITIRDLLVHASGIPAWRPYFREVTREAVPVAPIEVYRRILEEPLEAPVRTREIYSDLGFMLLGWTLESITGVGLDVLFSDLIFDPLGLPNTGFRKRLYGVNDSSAETELPIASTELCPWRGRVLTGEVHDENCYVMGMVAGHAGLFSTAPELDRIVLELMKGFHGESTIFNREGVRMFLKRQSIIEDGTWALGWDTPSPVGSTTGRYFSRNSFGHNGFTGTSVWMDMDKGVSVILLTNRIHPSRERKGINSLRQEIHDAVMECLGCC